MEDDFAAQVQRFLGASRGGMFEVLGVAVTLESGQDSAKLATGCESAQNVPKSFQTCGAVQALLKT